MMKWKYLNLVTAVALASLAVTGCKLSDLADDDNEDDSATSAVLLQGTVTDASGNPALGATVDIKDAHGDARRLTTDSNGRFVWHDEFDEDDEDAIDPFFGLKAPVVIRATLNSTENSTYYSVLCNTVHSSGNRVNVNALTDYTMERTSSINLDLFENWDNWDINPQSKYCNQNFANELTGIAGSLDGFNFFNSVVPSDALPLAFQTGLDELSQNGDIAINTGDLTDVEDSLGSLYAGYPVTWTLSYEGTVDGQPKSGTEAYTMSEVITIQQLKNQIVTLVAQETGMAQVNSLAIKQLSGTRLGDAGTAIIASLAGNVEALGLKKDFDLTLTFNASGALR